MKKLTNIGCLCAVLALAACATRSDERTLASVERGHIIAESACGQCHGLDHEASARSDAPAFRNIPFDLNSIRYERRVAELTRGHVGMPPQELSDDQLVDLAAYIRAAKQITKREGARVTP